MKYIKYFIQFILVIISFVIFKLIGPKLSSKLSGKIFEIIGPFFRSKKIVNSNIKKAFPSINSSEIQKISNSMWRNYGKIFAEFMFMKDFRFGQLAKRIQIEGQI